MTRVLHSLDREVLLSEDLAPVLSKWMERKLRAHRREWAAGSDKPNWSDGHAAHVQPFTPLARLALETGIDSRRIYAITTQECASVSLEIADEILMGIDEHVAHFDVYDSREVTAAVREQNELLRNIARANGQYIPPCNRKSQSIIARLRKQYLKAA